MNLLTIEDVFNGKVNIVLTAMEHFNIKTACSAKTYGNFLVPPQLDVPKWNIKFLNSSSVN